VPPAATSSRPHPFGRRRVLPAAIVVAIAAGVMVAVLGSAPLFLRVERRSRL
jgi:hypothetical protein